MLFINLCKVNGNVRKSIKHLLLLFMLNLLTFLYKRKKLEVWTAVPIALVFKLLANNGAMKENKCSAIQSTWLYAYSPLLKHWMVERFRRVMYKKPSQFLIYEKYRIYSNRGSQYQDQILRGASFQKKKKPI